MIEQPNLVLICSKFFLKYGSLPASAASKESVVPFLTPQLPALKGSRGEMSDMAANDSQDEKIDGPAVVADILNSMGGEKKNRLVRAIAKRSPELAAQIEEKLFNFDDLLNLHAKGFQILLQEIDQRDLVLSLKTTTQELREAIFNNLSSRRAEMILDEFEALPTVKIREVESAQRRILETLDELRTAGKITTRSPNDVYV